MDRQPPSEPTESTGRQGRKPPRAPDAFGLPIVTNVRHGRYTVYIGRAVPKLGLKRSPFANPFKIGVHGDRDAVLESYRHWIMLRPDLLERLPELRGQTLGCFCWPLACHGDVLIDLLKEIYQDQVDRQD